MHRQSVGSPNSRLALNGGGGGGAPAGDDAEKRLLPTGSDPSSAAAAEKPSRPGSPRPDRTIHLIPLLTLACLLILYLCSHEPSPKDMVGVGGAAVVIAAKAVSGTAERTTVGAGKGRWLMEAEAEAERRRLGSRKLGFRRRRSA